MYKFELFLQTREGKEATRLRDYYFDKKASISIGRHPRHDIHLDDMGVSGTHAKIHFFPVPMVEDLGSKNGTTLNGALIHSCASFKHRDVIGITRYGLRFLDQKMSLLEAADPFGEEKMPSTWLVNAPAAKNRENADSTQPDQDAAISPREFECLYWLSCGKTTAEISQLLKIGEDAVDYHIARICEKLGTTDRNQAVVKAVSLNLISP